MMKKTNKKVSIFLLFFMVFNIFTSLNTIEASAAETISFEMKRATGANNMTRTIFVNDSNAYGWSYCMEYSASIPNGSDVYYIPAVSKYAGTSLEKMIANIFYYGYPKVSMEQLKSKYGASASYNEYDILEFTNRVYWTAQKMYSFGIPFTMANVNNLNAAQLGGGKNNLIWQKDNPIIYGIMKDAVTDFQNGIYRTTTAPSTKLDLSEGIGFSVVENNANTVKIGPYKITTDSSLPSSQLNFDITINNPSAYAVNSTGNRITSVNVNDVFYVITNKVDVSTNISVKVSGIVDYHFTYEIAVSPNPLKQEMITTIKKPIYGEDELVVILEPPKPPSIDKKVNGQNEVTLQNRDETFTYTVNVAIPQDTRGYSSLEIRDQLEDVLEVQASAVDVMVDNVSVKSSGTLNISGNLVTFKFNSGFDYSTIAGKTVVVVIPAKVKAGISDEELIAKYGDTKVPNKATLIFNDKPTDSNEVKVTPPPIVPEEPTIDKKVNGQNEVILENREETFDYTINVKVPQNTAGYKSLEIRDQLEDVLEILESEVDVKVDNVSVKSSGTLSINGNLVIFKFNDGFDYSTIAGKTVVMNISAKVKSGVTDEELIARFGENKVPNKATLIFNNNPSDSNEVKVTPPPPPVIPPKEPEIDKKVNGKDEVYLENRDETFVYTVNVKVPQDTNGYASLEIRDELVDVLEIVNQGVDVRVDNASILSSGTLNINGNSVAFKFNSGFDYSTIAGKTVVMSINAKIKSGITDADLIAKFGENKAPNKATLVFNDKPSDSNEVKVVPPVIPPKEPEIDKKVNGQNEVQLENRNETFNYTINVKVPSDTTGYGSLEIRDELESVLEILNQGVDVRVDNVSVLSSGILNINGNSVSFKFNPGFDYRTIAGKTVVMSISAKIKDGVTDAELLKVYGETKVPNKATLIFNNNPSDSNEVKVVPPAIPPEEPTIGKKVNGTNEVTLENRNETFLYTIDVRVPQDTNGYTSLEIQDELEPVLEIVNQGVDVRVDNVSVLSSGTLNINGNSVSFKFADGFDYSTIAGKTVVMSISAKIRSGITDAELIAKYGENKAPNKATLIFNDKETISNEVKVKPPIEPPTEPNICKYVNGTSEVTLQNRNEEFLYTINVGVPANTAGYTSLEIRDELEPVLEIVGSDVDVRVDNVSILSSGRLSITGNSVSFKFNDGFNYNTIAGKTIIMSIKAKIKAGITDEELINRYGEKKVPNKATLIFNDKPIDSNEVKVEPPVENPTEPTICKSVNGKSEVTLGNRNETFLYAINVGVPSDTTGFKSLEIRDELEPVLEIVNSEVDVKVDNVSILSSGTLNIDGNVVTFKFNEGFDYSTLSGKTVIMTIKAKIKPGVSDEELINKYGEKKVPNKATLIFNDKPIDSNEVKVKPPTCDAKLGDYVWKDINKNGIQDQGEPPIPNVKVTLYDENGNKIKETLTDENGYYIFDNLCDGDYQLSFETPGGFKPTDKEQGTNKEVDSNIDQNGKTDIVTIKDGESDLTIDAGYVEIEGPPICKYVNGKEEITLENRDDTFIYTIEVPIPQDTTGYKSLEIKDQLEDVLDIQEADVKVDNASIKSSGTLSINNNLVSFKFSDGFDYSTLAGKTVVMTIDAKIKDGVTDKELIAKYGEKTVPNKATLIFNDKPTDSNEVKVKPPCEAKLGDYVWVDKNKNGLQDPGEPGIPNVEVTLYDENGTKKSTTTTDPTGYYIFEDLCDGDYQLSFKTPNGYKPTDKEQGANREIDSNIDENGKTDIVTIDNGESDLTIDAGYVEIEGPPICKYVNGKEEITLENRDDEFVYTIEVPIPEDTTGYKSLEIKDQLEDVLEIQEADVKVDNISIKSSGTLNINGNLVSFKFSDGFDYSTIAGKTVVMTIDAKIKDGVTDKELIAKYGEKTVPNKATLIFNDNPTDSNEVKVKPPCDAKLGDYVWVDVDRDGLQDPGEPGIPGVEVTLYDENGTKKNTTVTDENGYYIFEDLCDGKYQLSFKTPNGYKPTDKGVGSNKEVDSNIDENGKTDIIIIDNGESDLTIDAGYVEVEGPPICKYVNGEREITLENRDDEFVYTIEVPIPEDTTGYRSLEIKDQLEDVLEIQEADVKVDNVSIKSNGTLSSNNNLVSFKFSDGFDYSTIAGKTVVMSIKAQIKAGVTDKELIAKYGEKTVPNKATLVFNDKEAVSNEVKVKPPCEAKLGDYVWEDKNKNGIQDSGEPGIPGVKVTLYGENGNKIKETLTDNNGYYLFENICDGKYYLEFERPDGYKPTDKEQGTNKEVDSNIDKDGKTDIVVIDNGESDLTIDAGYVEIDEPTICKKVNGENNITLENRNDTFLYTVNVNIPKDTTGFKTLEIKDQLEPVLDILKDSVDVTVDGNSVKSSGTLTINNNLVTFKFNPGFDYKTIAGKTVVMSIKAQIKSGITDKELISKYGEKTVPNKATLIFNDKETVSNEVKVKPPCDAKLGDFVWDDKNANGIQDPGEPGIPGVEVTLYDEDGNKIKTTVTDENGYYLFENICDGSYYLEFETPDGYRPTDKEAGSDKEKDSNIDSGGKTDIITIDDGESDLTIDAGFVERDGPNIIKKVDGKDEVALDNREDTFVYTIDVPIDEDTTGYKSLEIRDELEPVLEIKDSEVDVTVDNVSIVSSGKLTINGNLVSFKFNNGFDYSTIAGKTVVMSIKAKIKSGVTNADIMSKYGENRVPNKATLIFNDKPIDSNEVKVKPPCEAKLGDFVWDDKNKNGIQDPGEPGIPGVEVILYDEDGNKIKTTVTDENGYYLFEDLCDGEYQLEFKTPDGYTPTENEAGDDKEKDSNIDSSGKTDIITIDDGKSDLTVDAGFVVDENPNEPKISKRVEGKSEVVLGNRNDSFLYAINVAIPKDTTGFKSLEIRDQLEDVLEIVNYEVDVRVDNNSVTTQGVLAITGNLVTFKFDDGFDYSTIAGKDVVMIIKARIRPGITDEELVNKYGENKVPNKATLIFNDKPSDSNIVKVQPPNKPIVLPETGEPSLFEIFFQMSK